MSCACIKGYYDFHLEHVVDDSYLYFDTSLWMEGERYAGVKEYDLELENLITGKKTQLHIVNREGVLVHDLSDIYLFRLTNCDTPYLRYGVAIGKIIKVYEDLIIKDFKKFKDDIIELKLRIDHFTLKINSYKEEVDKDEIIEEYNNLLDFVNLLKCKI